MPAFHYCSVYLITWYILLANNEGMTAARFTTSLCFLSPLTHSSPLTTSSTDAAKPTVTEETESTTTSTVSTSAPSSSAEEVLSTAESTLGKFTTLCRRERQKDASKLVARHLSLPNHSKQHMAVCSLSLHQESMESHKTLEQEFICQIGTLNSCSINKRFSFNLFIPLFFHITMHQPIA